MHFVRKNSPKGTSSILVTQEYRSAVMMKHFSSHQFDLIHPGQNIDWFLHSPRTISHLTLHVLNLLCQIRTHFIPWKYVIRHGRNDLPPKFFIMCFRLICLTRVVFCHDGIEIITCYPNQHMFQLIETTWPTPRGACHFIRFCNVI